MTITRSTGMQVGMWSPDGNTHSAGIQIVGRFFTRPATHPTKTALGTDHVYESATGKIVGTIDKLTEGRARLYVDGRATNYPNYTAALQALHQKLR